MINDKQETIADIVAMLRANARGDRFDDFSFTSLADRIESAMKREVTRDKSLLETLRRWKRKEHEDEL